MVSVSPLRLAGAVAVLPPLPRPGHVMSSRAVHMRSLAELQKAAAMHTHPDVVYGAMIPDPDYSDEDLDQLSSKLHYNSKPIAAAALNKSSPKNNSSCSSTSSSSSSSGIFGKTTAKTKGVSPPPPPHSSHSPVQFSSSSPPPHSSSPTTTTHTTSSSPTPPNMVARNNRVNANSDDSSKAPVSPLLQHKDNKNERFDEHGFVLPKKLANPSLESTEKKSLHRELLFNQKVGVSVLNQKTELQKAMEKHKGKQIAKEQEREKKANLTPFQKALEQQALKLEQKEKVEEKSDDPKKEPEATHEFQKLQAKLRSKLEAQ